MDEKQIVSDLKKLHAVDETKKKSKEYYKQYYRENKEKYKKRYQQNKSEILDKMKANRQQKKKKSRGIFTIRHLKTEETFFSPEIEDNPEQQTATSPPPI
jgi:hypothetical protein